MCQPMRRQLLAGAGRRRRRCITFDAGLQEATGTFALFEKMSIDMENGLFCVMRQFSQSEQSEVASVWGRPSQWRHMPCEVFFNLSVSQYFHCKTMIIRHVYVAWLYSWEPRIRRQQLRLQIKVFVIENVIFRFVDSSNKLSTKQKLVNHFASGPEGASAKAWSIPPPSSVLALQFPDSSPHQ